MTTVFICGQKPDHKCDSDGPTICGGHNEDGSYWEGPDTEENRRRAQWGSVSCSVCGEAAINTAPFMGWA
jgi:hypothetical protein